MKKIKIYTNQILVLVKIYLFKFLSLVFVHSEFWVICERGTDARDNGYHFYNYIKKFHPEMKVYYIIDKDSPDYYRVKSDAVHYGSLKNYWIVASAEKIISSHYGTVIPNLNPRLFKLTKLYKKYYFLQHGIIKDKLVTLFGDVAPMKLFICGAKPEFEYVLKNFKHKKNVVKYTGLARFDNLYNCNKKKQILIMPTWRSYIKSETDFLDSTYYKCWQNVITNKKIIDLLIQKDYQLIFYPHYEIQKYIHHFFTVNNRVILADLKNFDVQNLLKESMLLITDYSSVYFDFAYMNKPVVYYQFDSDEFFEKHYNQGYFNYKINGFGPVCEKYEDVVNEIIKYVNNNFEIEKKYALNIEKFFPLRDESNCERIYKEVVRS